MTDAFTRRFKTSKNLAEDGVWVDFGDGIMVKIRRYSSKASRDTRRKLEKPYRGAASRTGTLPDDISERITVQQLAEAIIVEWKGLPDQYMPYSVENALKLLSDPEFQDFRDSISLAAIEGETFKDPALDEQAKGN